MLCWLLFVLTSVARAARVVNNPEATQKWADQFNATLTRALQNNIIIPDWGYPSRNDDVSLAGSAGVDFAYESVAYGFGEQGATGMSYYIRAWDIFPRHYTNQLGWGQWIGPAEAQDADAPCPLNPHNLICYPSDKEGPNPENYFEVRDCTRPEGDDRLNDCNDGWCADKGEYFVFGTLEGGMGYWPYTTGHNGVKFLTPSTVSGYYDKFGGHFVLGLKQPCTNMGGAVQVSNNLVFPADFFSFEEDGEGYTDGFLGYMLQRTPIGNLHKDDNRNYWTVILDSDNWAGPVVYASAYHWEHPNSWQPGIKTFADPDVKIKYTQHGTEGGVGVTVVQKDGWYWMRTQEVVMPLDNDDDSTTVFSNHAQYHNDWMHDVLEPILDGTKVGGRPRDIRDASAAAREKPDCFLREADGVFDRNQWTISVYSEEGDIEDHPTGGFIVSGWGVGDHHENIFDNIDEADGNWCRTKIPIDKSNPNLKCDDKKCKLSPYFRLPVDRRNQIGEIIPEDEMPADVKAAVDARAESLWEEPSRVCDGSFLEPSQDDPDSTCFNTPGPASDKVYCRRTTDERWIAYQWYRFVDQPELNQVFASLPKDEQMEAKCFMQSRIERLHQMQARETVPRWFDTPGDLPTSKAKIDQGFIVEPPAGFEVGYVPVSIYSKVREMPPNCDVVEGLHNSEPDPLPSDYYLNREEGDPDRYPDMCYETDVSNGSYDRVGTLFLSARDGSGDKIEYRVPHRDQVEASLADKFDPGQCEGATPVTPTPTPAPGPSPGGPVFCFSGEMMVDVEEKGLVPMSRLEVGDKVLAADNRYDHVYTFGHRVEHGKAEYLQILPSRLELSADHMVFVLGKGAIPASMVEVGDSFLNGEVVERIRTVIRQGVYAPFTHSGTIVVNGVLASTYISFQESEMLKFGSLKTLFTFQWIAHTFHAPHRIWCHWLGMHDELLDNGLSSLTEPSFQAAKWFLGQNPVVMAAAFVPFLLLLLIFTGIEGALMHPVLMAAAGIAMVVYRKGTSLGKQAPLT